MLVWEETETESSDTVAECLLSSFGLGFGLEIGEGSAGVSAVLGGSTTSLGAGTAVSCDAGVESFREEPPPLPPRPPPRPPLFPRLPSRVDVLRWPGSGPWSVGFRHSGALLVASARTGGCAGAYELFGCLGNGGHWRSKMWGSSEPSVGE